AKGVYRFHEERFPPFSFSEQGERADLDRLTQKRAEDRLQRPLHPLRFSLRHASRQGHMEAEVVENMGVTPSRKISQLRWRELFRSTPLVFFLRQRSAKRLERLDDLVCKLIELGRRAIRHNREKPTEARHLHLLHDRSTH